MRPGDYFALLAFIEMNDAHRAALQAIRMLVRDKANVATSVGFGPRFLHSTGQAHKGGPNTGVFLQITGDDPEDLPVPGQRYSFGTIKLAQARGDFEVLASRGRRLLRMHLRDVSRGLEASARHHPTSTLKHEDPRRSTKILRVLRGSSCYPTWTRGRRSGFASDWRSTSRVTGAVSPSPNARNFSRYVIGFPSVQPKYACGMRPVVSRM